jgi:hypothetical protein
MYEVVPGKLEATAVTLCPVGFGAAYVSNPAQSNEYY